jgi:hypothetical protein
MQIDVFEKLFSSRWIQRKNKTITIKILINNNECDEISENPLGKNSCITICFLCMYRNSL